MAHAASSTGDGSLSAWQRHFLLASQSVMAGEPDRHNDYFYSASEYSNDNDILDNNASNGCAIWLMNGGGPDCSSCETAVLLRWARILFYKVARTYMAAPLLLALVPLCLGLLVGVWAGIRWESRRRRSHQQCVQGKLAVDKCTVEVACEEDCGGVRSVWILNSLYKHIPFLQQQHSESIELKENRARTDLKSDTHTTRESGVEIELVPKHVAVIMDGNRRYGKARYDNVAKGHWDGSRTLVDFAKWCIAEGVQALTVYAFSTENWNRDASEVAALMAIFAKYCDELRVEALERNIRIHVLSTDFQKIPNHVKVGLRRMVEDTKHCDNGLTMNICLSYGSRGEIVNACKSLATDARDGVLCPEDISERRFNSKLLTSHCADPDVVIRTSGEYRLSNFLLWQLAYTEMFFVPKQWPELEKKDLLNVIQTYANGRRRRFGK